MSGILSIATALPENRRRAMHGVILAALAFTAMARAVEFSISDSDRQHWAFQPIKRATVPQQGNPIDHFIRAKLAETGLKPAPRTTPEALIRRITLDLVGLPPAPREMDAFIEASKKNPAAALASLIDRLLASPHYGERWGRHWLDLARFAETDGFEHDAVRPNLWRYRDYVIQSFNDDKPYDRFIREQIAGDELWPQEPSTLIATGFNLLGPDMVDSSDQVQRRHNTLNDMTDTCALVFLGLTMGCARCHDHKFEPISQRDYYSLQAFFTPVKINRDKPVPIPEALAAYEAAMKVFNEHPKVRALLDLEAPVRQQIFEHKVSKLSPEAQVAHHTPEDQRDAEQANLVLETADKVLISEKELSAAFKGEEKEAHQKLQEEVRKLPKPASLPKAMVLSNSDKAAAKAFVLRRGEYSQPLDEVGAGFPTVLGRAETAGLENPTALTDRNVRPPSGNQSMSRTALAEWIASPQNPLTARVMVNRIWQHHFGRGLVASPSEFGTHGAKPSHPELLDWLASEFIAGGWSIKKMHKLMLMSETYQQRSDGMVEEWNDGKLAKSQSSNPPAFQNSIDPENRLLWRMNRLRLEGEVIRDNLLAISGQLNLAMGGPGVFPPIPKEISAGSKGGWQQNDHVKDYSRRSVYIFARRNLRFPFLEVFDAPDSNLSCPVRERSTTAPQSLTLLNADEVITASKLTASRLQREAKEVADQVTLAYRLVLGRKPDKKELSLARQFLAQSPMHEFCRALFNLNDFVYVE